MPLRALVLTLFPALLTGTVAAQTEVTLDTLTNHRTIEFAEGAPQNSSPQSERNQDFTSRDDSPGLSQEEEDVSPASPSMLSLSEAYPNPFNSAINIDLTLPQEGRIRVELYDITGRHVRSIARGAYAAGTYTLNVDATGLPSGTCFVRADATNGGHAVRKITVTRVFHE